MKYFNIKESNFYKKLGIFLDKRSFNSNVEVEKYVKGIIKKVKLKGDKYLFEMSKKFDGVDLNKSNIKVSKKTINKYKNEINSNYLNSFKIAIKNITNFHKKQIPSNYELKKNNRKIGMVWKPIKSVGLYVPGGKAFYPSSLIMNAIPAKVAGVKRIVLVTPSNKGLFNPYILALIDLLEIKEVYQVGGAQAIAALAYGTESIKPVNKIFGPGNAFVTNAKKLVFGKVGIDLIAGPSEIVVVADESNNPTWVATDLIAQAEHDEKAQSILITSNFNFAKKVQIEIKRLLNFLPNKKIISKSLKNYGAVIIVKDYKKISEIIDFIAPEHLHIQSNIYKEIFKNITNVGCVFLGEYSTEAFGDYIVGTNHILPTSGSAKYSSGLGVLDFMKRISYVQMNKKSSNELRNHVINMSSIENLEGHQLSVKVRQKNKKSI